MHKMIFKISLFAKGYRKKKTLNELQIRIHYFAYKFVFVFFFLAHKLPEKPYYKLRMGNCEQAVLINEKLEAIFTY